MGALETLVCDYVSDVLVHRAYLIRIANGPMAFLASGSPHWLLIYFELVEQYLDWGASFDDILTRNIDSKYCYTSVLTDWRKGFLIIMTFALLFPYIWFIIEGQQLNHGGSSFIFDNYKNFIDQGSGL